MTSRGAGDRLLERMCRLAALAVLPLAALAYPWRMSVGTLIEWAQGAMPDAWARAFVLHFEPYLTFGYSPLMLKETLVCSAILCLFVCFVGWQAFWSRQSSEDTKRFGAVAGLLVLLAVSAIWMSPTYYYSLKSLLRVACVAAYFLMVGVLARESDLLRRGAVCIVIVSAALSVISLLQHFGLTLGILTPYPDPRNRVGSFIGHNTGLSSYLMMALMLTVSMMFGRGGRLAKGALGLAAGLQCFVIVLAQSRAVWLIVLILGPLLAIAAQRCTGLGPRARHWAIMATVAFAILASQLVPPPLNVLSVRDYPLARRLKDFSLDQMRRETRTRILFVSARMLAREPARALVGYGLGSFQYVYPLAQMEYYSAHPRMWIEPTDKRTTRAHNDYLQLLIETGLIGLALVGGLIFVEVKRGWRRARSAIGADARGEAARLGIGFALFAVALHALVDFPAHVISLSSTWVFLLAVWSGTPAPGEERPRVGATSRSAVGGARRLSLAALSLVGATALAGFGICGFTRELTSDFYNRQGSAAYRWVIDNYAHLADEERLKALASADWAYRRASRLEPLCRQISSHRPQPLMLQGETLMRRMYDLEARGDAQSEAQMARQQAVSRFESAIAHTRDALGEYRNHVSLYLLGTCLRRAYLLTGNPDYLREAGETLEQATRYAPPYVDAAFELMGLYARERIEPARVLDLKRSLVRYAPDVFEEQYERRAYDLRYNGRYREALPMFRALTRIGEYEEVEKDARMAPEASRIQRHYIETLIDVGMRAEAEAELRKAETRFDGYEWLWKKTRVHMLVVDGKWDEVATLSRRIIENNPDPGDNDFWETLEAVAMREANAPGAAEKMREIRRKAVETPIYQMYLGFLEANWLHNRDAAIRELTTRVAQEPPADAYIYGRLALLEFEAGMRDSARAHARVALKQKPSYERMTELLAELKNGLE